MKGNTSSFGLDAGQAIDKEAQDAVRFFNQRLRLEPLQPIQEEESTPARLEGVAAGLRMCEDAECRAIAEQCRGLAFGENGSPYTPAQKNAPAWREKVRDLLAALSRWQESALGADPTTTEHFREESAAYSDLLNLVFNGPDRDVVVRAMLDYLKQNRFQKENRLEWFLPVSALIGRVALDPVGMGRVAEELRKMDDPTIALYANLETVAPRTPDRILPLL
jgi:hypothetical protein